jgi:hypothetical protein
MSVLNPADAAALDVVLNAACQHYATDTTQLGLRLAIDQLDALLIQERGYHDEALRKHAARNARATLMA